MPATRSTTLLPGLLDRLADYRRLRQAATQGKSPLALSGLACRPPDPLRRCAPSGYQASLGPGLPRRRRGPPGRRGPGRLSGRRGPRPHGAGLFSSAPAPPAASGSSSAWPS
ncbi:MAG: hypothetical protein ACLUNZ_01410 [Evtepia sp.]